MLKHTYKLRYTYLNQEVKKKLSNLITTQNATRYEIFTIINVFLKAMLFFYFFGNVYKYYFAKDQKNKFVTYKKWK